MSTVPAERLGAVAKVVAVVESLTEYAGITDIARATGLPTSTVHRILSELHSLGWARRDGERGYRPGAALLTLAARAETDAGLTSVVRPVLERLRDRTTHTVHFALRQGDQVVYAVKLDGQRPYVMKSRIGLAVHLHSTAIGKAVLAALPTEEVRAIARRTGLPAMAPNTVTDPDELIRQLQLVARRGFALDHGENEQHLLCIGAAVHDHRASPVGGLSVSALAVDVSRAEVREFTPLVVAAAREITAALAG